MSFFTKQIDFVEILFERLIFKVAGYNKELLGHLC